MLWWRSMRDRRPWLTMSRLIYVIDLLNENPRQNAYIERYNRTARYDWLGQYLFDAIEEVPEFATCWLWTYNHERRT